MGKIKYTKNALRGEQNKLKQLQIYLPTLKLKKKLLQFEVLNSSNKINVLEKELFQKKEKAYEFCSLLNEKDEILSLLEILHVDKSYENIAGIELPIFKEVKFKQMEYSLFDTPIWFDRVLLKLKEMISIFQNILSEKEKKEALKKELRDVTIRVNLFEKILIPRTLKNIKKIKIFLSDQELSLISQAKVAKNKILKKAI